MLITRVMAVAFRVPLAAALYRGAGEAGSRIYWGGRRSRVTPQHPDPTRDYVIVRIETDEGITGIGETQPDIAFYGQSAEQVRAHLNDYLGPQLVGKDPFKRDYLLHLVDYPSNCCAQAALDLALHDLIAKALGTSVGTLLGGLHRKRVPVAIEIAGAAASEMANECRALAEKGVRAFKAKIGGHPEADAERLVAMREAIGPDAILRADANQGYTVKQAIALCRLAEKSNVELELLEQPVVGHDLHGMAQVRRSVDIPIEADESCFSVEDALAVVRHSAADVINIKLSKAGGLANATRIAAVADAAGIQCVLGTSFGVGIEVAAKLQFATCTLDVTAAVEFTELAYHENFLTSPHDKDLALPLEDGCLAVPDGPGMGVTLRDVDVFQLAI